MIKKHTVAGGENLSTIAAKYNLPGWHALYFAPENQEFRRNNQDPDRIFPGQVINIPFAKQHVRQVLQIRLERLRKVRLESQQIFTEQRQALNEDLKEIKRNADGVDAAATVLLLMHSLAKLTHSAAQTMKLEGVALSQANKEFAKEALSHSGDNLKGAVAQAVSATRQDSSNAAWLVTRSVAQSYCDLTSPSFWANTFVNLYEGKSWTDSVNTKPEDVFEQSLAKLNGTQAKVMQDLEKKIREVELELVKLNTSPLI